MSNEVVGDLENAGHFPASHQMSLSDGEETAPPGSLLYRKNSSPKLPKKKIVRIKRSRNYDSCRSLTDPNLKDIALINGDSNSDSTPNISDWTPNLPPTGLSRCRSPRPLRSTKSPSSEQVLSTAVDGQNLPNKTVKSVNPLNLRQRMVSRFGSNVSNSSLPPSSPSSSPLAFSFFKHNDSQTKQGNRSKEAATLNETSKAPPPPPPPRANAKQRTVSGGSDRSKLRLSSISSCLEQDSTKPFQSPSASTNQKSPFGKMKSFKDGFTSPDPNKYKQGFASKYATVSSKKHLALLRKYSLPSEYFTLKFDADDPGELIPSPPGQTLEQAIQASILKRGLTIDTIEVYLDSSRTPLPMSSDTFLLANSVLWVKVKENRPTRVSIGQSVSVEPRKRQSSLTRFKKILTSLEDIRVSDLGDSQKNKVNHKTRLHSFLGSFSKQQQDKQEQVLDLLGIYSQQGLPKMPDLLSLGRPNYDKGVFKLEKHWTEILSDEYLTNKHQKDQQEALWEMLVTEVEYIEKLQVITDLFVCCLINLQNDLILNEIEVDKLCSNIVDVFYATCHFWVTFLSPVVKYSRDSKKPLDPSLLKPGFLLFDKIFEPYKKYCLEQEVCRDYIKNQLKDNELFKIFILWAESQPQCKRLKLTDLIVSPFQRLTRYKLLLYAIQGPINRHIKATSLTIDRQNGEAYQSWPGCYEQKQDIDIMVEQVEKFVNEVNVAMRLSQDHQQLSQIVDKIETYEVVEAPNEECARLIQKFSRFDLTMPIHGCSQYETRALIMEGVLRMKDSNTKCDVHCYLFTDMFLVTKMTFKKTEKVKFKVIKTPMRLDKIVIHELKDGGSFVVIYLNEFHLVQNLLFLLGDSRLWVDAIVKAQKDYKQKRWVNSRKSDLSQHFDPTATYNDVDGDLLPTFHPQITKSSSSKSQRSTSVNDCYLKFGVTEDLSPSSYFSQEPSSLFGMNNDDDEGLISSILRFSSEKITSRKTTELHWDFPAGENHNAQKYSINNPDLLSPSSPKSPTGSFISLRRHDNDYQGDRQVTRDSVTMAAADAAVEKSFNRDRRSKSTDDVLLTPSSGGLKHISCVFIRTSGDGADEGDDGWNSRLKSLSHSLPNHLDRDDDGDDGSNSCHGNNYVFSCNNNDDDSCNTLNVSDQTGDYSDADRLDHGGGCEDDDDDDDANAFSGSV